MNNEELKKKIVEILFPVLKGSRISCNEENAYKQCWFPCEVDRLADSLADALIAAGIGDVSELQKECDSKEEAYNKCYFDFKHWKDKAKEYKHCAARAERALHCLARSFAEAMCKYGDDTHYLADGFIQDAYSQAEKELAKEFVE